MRVRVGDPVDLSAFAGRELDADTLHAASDRIMDALTAELVEIRKASAPTHRFAMERKTTTDTTNTEGEQT